MEPHSGRSVAGHQVIEDGMKFVARFSGLASDSREVGPGYLFAALPGSQVDGRAFIPDAVRRGAVAVLGRPEVCQDVERLGVQFIADENPRARLAQFAAAFFGAQPATIAAVTGTNGKTSVAVFLRQIWTQLGYTAASIGTVGVVAPSGEITLKHTTPGPIELHRLFAKLKADGVDRLVLEASSHGLDQYRLDGVKLAAAGFTNISRDHLDYHADFSHYLAAKLRLFSELMPKGGVAVINADVEHGKEFAAVASARGLVVLTVGRQGESLKLLAHTPHGDGQALRIAHGGDIYNVALPLAGEFQASNALVAAGLAIGLGDLPDKVFAALEALKGAPGRLEKVAAAPSGAPIYIDYAHTPDALETVLTALRPHVRNALVVVFGCGGDRDRGKRALMGEAVARHADRVVVTDDNPRSENPAAIRDEILSSCPGATEIGDRATAIQSVIASLEGGDVLVIAGKGHERGQIVGDKTHPFSDREVAVKAALALGGSVVGRAQ